MTRKSVLDEQYGQLWRRLEEVARRVDEGTIQFEPTMAYLQAIVEERLGGAIPPVPVPANPCPVVVDYDLSLADMIATGIYDWTNSDITAEHFPFIGEGKAEMAIELVHFGRIIEDGDECLRELDKMGLRAATLPELLAFGAKYPDMQRRFPVVALGSIWQRRDGDRNVPALWERDRGRRLDLRWFEHRWREHCRFAAVRK